MLLARVEGNIVATRKHPSLDGWRLVICQPIGADGKNEGAPQVAIDSHGAGMHQQVVISSDGKAARNAVGDQKSPVRWLVIGVVDEHEPGGENMKLGTVIGRVTLSKTVSALEGGRFLVVSPFSREQFEAGLDAPRSMGKDPSLVVYDAIGGGVGDVIGYEEGAEAAQPFETPTPVDALNAALVDEMFFNPWKG